MDFITRHNRHLFVFVIEAMALPGFSTSRSMAESSQTLITGRSVPPFFGQSDKNCAQGNETELTFRLLAGCAHRRGPVGEQRDKVPLAT